MRLLEKSGNALDQFIKDDSFLVGDDISCEVDVFFEEIQGVVCTFNGDINEIIAVLIKQGDNHNQCNLFMEWLKEYIDMKRQIIQETEFIRKFTAEEFETNLEFCMNNLVLYNYGRKLIEKNQYNYEEMMTLKKVINTAIEMKVTERYAEELLIEKMKNMFNMLEEHIKSLWLSLEKHDEAIWKIVAVRRSDRIEQKLDYILDILTSKI